MREVNEIIGRAENLLCISDRCGVEERVCEGIYYTRRRREMQRLRIYNWLKRNDFARYMTQSELSLFEKKVGIFMTPVLRQVISQKSYEHEAVEPLLWALGLVKRLSSYDRFVLTDFHGKLDNMK